MLISREGYLLGDLFPLFIHPDTLKIQKYLPVTSLIKPAIHIHVKQTFPPLFTVFNITLKDETTIGSF